MIIGEAVIGMPERRGAPETCGALLSISQMDSRIGPREDLLNSNAQKNRGFAMRD